MNPYYEKARLAFERQRFDIAEKELEAALSHDPNDANALNLLTFVFISQGKKQEALEVSENCLSVAPDWPMAWYSNAYAHWMQESRGSTDRALEAIGRAITIDPTHADFQYLRGEIYFSKGNWEQALENAENALGLDAENVGALNLRAKSLVKLNRVADANDTLDFAIRNEPENPNSHANKGWALIERDQYDEALVHFKEALRIDPRNVWAKEGLKNAIKGKNFLYRYILKYFLWMGKMSEQYQWAFIIGLYVGYQVLLRATDSYPQLAPLTYPLIAFYVFFAFSSWIAVPFSNLFLRLHPMGKHALTNFEKRGSSILGMLILAGIITAVMYYIQGTELLLFGAIWCLMMCIPLGATFGGFQANENTSTMLKLSLGIGAVGILALVGIGIGNEALVNFAGGIFALSILGFSFLANYFVGRRGR